MNLLDVKLTYHEFCDIMSTAWLIAEEETKAYPPKEFRLKLFTYLEDNVKEKFEL